MTAVAQNQDLASYDLFVDGTWLPAAPGDTSERRSPSTGQLVGRYARGTEVDVDRTVAAARRAFDESPWPTLGAPQRSAALPRGARPLPGRAPPRGGAAGRPGPRADFRGGQTTPKPEKPISMARNEVVLTAEVFDYYA